MLCRLSDVWDEFARMNEVGLAYDSRLPCVDIYDTGDSYLLMADVPGFSKKDIEITIDRDVLTLSGERKSSVPEGCKAHRLERGSQKFSRSFSFPVPIDTEKVRAEVQEGVLKVELAKADSAKPRRLTVH